MMPSTEEELERPMISKLIENIRSCGVSFKVYPKKMMNTSLPHWYAMIKKAT